MNKNIYTHTFKFNDKTFKTNHFKTIRVTLKPATNTNGTRISLYDSRLNQRKTIPYNYKYNSILEMVIKYLLDNNHKSKIVGFTSNTNGYNILIDDFNFELKNLK